MTAAADLVLRGGEIRFRDGTYDAVAVRDGRVVRRAADYEAQFLTGVETTTVELAGRTVLPGFVDARAEFGRGLSAFRARAHATGVTTAHVRASPELAARCRDAASGGDLGLRVRLQYPATLRSSLLDVGLRTNHGERVETGALAISGDASDCRERAVRAAEAGFQVAIEVSTRAGADDAAAALADCRPHRHRIEGAVPHADALDGFEGVVVTDGRAEGVERVVESDATLAFGGGDPLETVSAAVDAGLDPETALRAHTHGGRVAGFETGTARADFVAFDGDPLADPAGASVALTLADGAVVHDDR